MTIPVNFLQSLVKRIEAIAADREIIPDVGVHSDFVQKLNQVIAAKTGVCDIADLLLFVEGALAYACAHHGVDYGARRDCFSKIVNELLDRVDAVTKSSIDATLSDPGFLPKRKAYVDPFRVAGENRADKERKTSPGGFPFVPSGEPGVSGYYAPPAY